MLQSKNVTRSGQFKIHKLDWVTIRTESKYLNIYIYISVIILTFIKPKFVCSNMNSILFN